ncbi:MAG TPA: hypothetical protein DCQ06_05835 [Myxococcales bacterium]|nr:hypothetical protein [Myxococcales bacterium]
MSSPCARVLSLTLGLELKPVGGFLSTWNGTEPKVFGIDGRASRFGDHCAGAFEGSLTYLLFVALKIIALRCSAL